MEMYSPAGSLVQIIKVFRPKDTGHVMGCRLGQRSCSEEVAFLHWEGDAVALLPRLGVAC